MLCDYNKLLGVSSITLNILVSQTALKTCENFPYLGSILSNDCSYDAEIRARTASRLWNTHDISLSTKFAVYRAAILTVLLYGSETWTLHRRHIQQLDRFHLRCLRHIAHIQWQSRTQNTDVLEKCKTTGIEAFLLQARLRWIGHVARMPDDRIHKVLFCFGELAIGKRSVGAPRKRYKDTTNCSVKALQIDPSTFEELVTNRGRWRRTIRLDCQRFEEDRIHVAREQRRTRKEREQHQQHSPPRDTAAVFPCDQCGRSCLSKIELFSHTRWHTTQKKQ